MVKDPGISANEHLNEPTKVTYPLPPSFLPISPVFVYLLLLTSCPGQEVDVTVNVVPPRSTPQDAQLFIAGNHPTVGDWQPGKVAMQKVSDSLWTFALSLPKEYFFEFKITRGSWNTQAIYTKGEIPPNAQLTLAKDTIITLRPIGWSDSDVPASGGITGTVRYHRNLEGEGLDYARDVIVWLPPSYQTDTTKRYPVLYMHDGQNVFDPRTSFIGYDWHVDEVADSLIRAGKMQEIIVVGIYNSPDRRDEYDDTVKGRAYLNFIIERVKPLIDSAYRTLPNRANTDVMGSSMGGLISFLMIWHHPDVFSQAGCVSPVFWEKQIDAVKAYSGADKNIRLYIDNGGLGLERELQAGIDAMLPVLKEKGFVEGKNLEWYFDADAEHSERAWAKRVWRPLVFMFGK